MARPRASEAYEHKALRGGNIQYTTSIPAALGRKLELAAQAEQRTTSNLLWHIIDRYIVQTDDEVLLDLYDEDTEDDLPKDSDVPY